MQPTVLIVEDSPSTAHLARLALTELDCQVAVTPDPARALELAHGPLPPWVVVVDAHLAAAPEAFFAELHDAAPRAAMVLLFDRGVHTPRVPLASAQLYKPLQPRRFQRVVVNLIVTHPPADPPGDLPPGPARRGR